MKNNYVEKLKKRERINDKKWLTTFLSFYCDFFVSSEENKNATENMKKATMAEKADA